VDVDVDVDVDVNVNVKQHYNCSDKGKYVVRCMSIMLWLDCVFLVRRMSLYHHNLHCRSRCEGCLRISSYDNKSSGSI
jgi:hypothetical protein